MRQIAVVLLLGASLAGCIGDDAVGGADENVEAAGLPAGVPQLVASTGCADQLGLFPMAMEDAAAYVPEGFEPMPYPVDPTGTQATIYILAASCTDAAVDGVSAGEERSFSGGVLVTPPSEYLSDAVDYYAVLFGIWNTNPEAVAALNAWGIDAAGPGDVAFDIADTPLGRAGTASGSSDGFMVTMRTTALGPAEVGPEGVIRLFSYEVEDEDEMGDEDEADEEEPELAGAVDVHWTENAYAEGVAQFDENFEVIPGVPFFAEPGLGAQSWGDDYAFHSMPAWLPVMEDEDGDEEEEDDVRNLFGMVI